MLGRLFWGEEERRGELKVERRQQGAMSDVEAVLIEPRGGREGGNFFGRWRGCGGGHKKPALHGREKQIPRCARMTKRERATQGKGDSSLRRLRSG
jgi:hypothetical protein